MLAAPLLPRKEVQCAVCFLAPGAYADSMLLLGMRCQSQVTMKHREDRACVCADAQPPEAHHPLQRLFRGPVLGDRSVLLCAQVRYVVMGECAAMCAHKSGTW